MEQQISQLLELSAELAGRLDSCGFEEIEAYMTRRNAIFVEMQRAPVQASPGEETKARIRRLTEIDQAIVGRMKHLHEQIGSEITRIQNGKKSRTMYERYAQSYDGDFFDTRR